MTPLRLRTWLAPSLPFALYRHLGERIALGTGLPVVLDADASVSGPAPWLDDPFARGEVDVGFVCSPSWAWLGGRSIVAVPALPVPLDPRAEGRPVYFSDVVVASGSSARSLADLAGLRWAYNDPCSLSGWFALRQRIGEPRAYFSEVVASGSHLRSLAWVAEGRVDGAAIDSTVLGWVLRADARLASALRVVESFGPHPIQPVVARRDLPPGVIRAVADALCSLRPGARELAPYGLAGFVAGAPPPLTPDLRDEVARAMPG